MPTLAEEFVVFIAKYPRRIARMDAEKAYGQIRRKGVTHERIMAGLDLYLQHLPEDACFIPYPASWLRAGRFDDEYPEAVPVPAREYWADVCQREHGSACRNRWDHEMKLREQAS
jgi:hypothetical protein